MTTSYKSDGLEELLSILPRIVQAKKIVEFGTQQGNSAILLSEGGAKVKTYDTFDKHYSKPPFKETHANPLMALENTYGYNIDIYQMDANKVKPIYCDILHIDICNHKDNVSSLVKKWYPKVKKLIILEGGVLNKWQKKYRFKPYVPPYKHIIVKGVKGYAMTIIVK